MDERNLWAYHEAGHVVAAAVEHRWQVEHKVLGVQAPLVRQVWIADVKPPDGGPPGAADAALMVLSPLTRQMIRDVPSHAARWLEHAFSAIRFQLGGLAAQARATPCSLEEARAVHDRNGHGDWPEAAQRLGDVFDPPDLKRVLQEQMLQVVATVEAHWPEVVRIAEALVARGRLTGADVETLLEGSKLVEHLAQRRRKNRPNSGSGPSAADDLLD